MDIDKLLGEEVDSLTTQEWTGEFGSETITLYAKSLSPADMDVVMRKHPDVMTNPKPSSMVELIMLKARDKDEKKVFSPGKHRTMLLNIGVTKIGEMFKGLFAEAFEDDEVVEKN